MPIIIVSDLPIERSVFLHHFNSITSSSHTHTSASIVNQKAREPVQPSIARADPFSLSKLNRWLGNRHLSGFEALFARGI